MGLRGLLNIRFQQSWLLIALCSILAASCAETDDGGPQPAQPYDAFVGDWTLSGSLNVGPQVIPVPGMVEFLWTDDLAVDQVFAKLSQNSPFDSTCGVTYEGVMDIDEDTNTMAGVLKVTGDNLPDSIKELRANFNLEPRTNRPDEYRFKIVFDASATAPGSIHHLCEDGPDDGISGTITRVQ